MPRTSNPFPKCTFNLVCMLCPLAGRSVVRLPVVLERFALVLRQISSLLRSNVMGGCDGMSMKIPNYYHNQPGYEYRSTKKNSKNSLPCVYLSQ